jgi:hypothetical protein
MVFFEEKNQETFAPGAHPHVGQQQEQQSFCFFCLRKSRTLPSCRQKI